MEYSLQDVLGWLAPVAGRWVNGDQFSKGSEGIRVDDASELAQAKESDIAFFFSKAYQDALLSARPGILITAEPFVKPLEASGLPAWKSTAVIACLDPYRGMAICLEKIAELRSSVVHQKLSTAQTQVHGSAVLSAEARLDARVRVGPQCIIEEGASIGEGSILYPGCYIGRDVRIGKRCVLFPRVTLYERTHIGDDVRIHSGAVLGADGFGYAPIRGANGMPQGHQKIFHLGRVWIGDHVEIGANTCIDRGTLGDTRVESHAKIDDLVMVGHNCQIEEGAIICGKAGLSGRARVGKYAMIGGAAGLCNDVHVGDLAQVAAHCLVAKDVPARATVVGNTQRDFTEHFRLQVLLNRMLGERKKRGIKKNEV